MKMETNSYQSLEPALYVAGDFEERLCDGALD